MFYQYALVVGTIARRQPHGYLRWMKLDKSVNGVAECRLQPGLPSAEVKTRLKPALRNTVY